MSKKLRIYGWLVPLAGLAVVAAALAFLYRDLDVNGFVRAVSTANLGWLFVFAGTVLLEQLVRAWKWRQFLYDLRPVSTLRLFGAIMAGYGAAIVVPLGISPLVRAWLVARLEGLRLPTVLATVAIERFVDGVVFGLIALLVAFAAASPAVDGNLHAALAAAGAVGVAAFGSLIWISFRYRNWLARGDTRFGRLVDRLTARGGRRFAGFRSTLVRGIVWPRSPARQAGIVAASVAIKAIAATHYAWSGLAVGVTLAPFEYLFLMVFSGYALVLSRLVRIPGGLLIGSGIALQLLGVPDDKAAAMILLTFVISLGMMVTIGLTILWRSGVRIRALREVMGQADDRP